MTTSEKMRLWRFVLKSRTEPEFAGKLCDDFDDFVREVDELEDKIESLGEYNEFLEDCVDRQSDRINKLLISYKRLRMFAATVWELLTRNEPRLVWADMEERAKELGIEKMEVEG